MNEELLQNETLTMADLEDHFDDANPWNVVTGYMEKGTVLSVKIEGIVNGGAIAMVEGLRGFIPASKLSLSYVENLEDYLLQDMDVQIIDVDQANNRLILSARELLKEKARKEKALKKAEERIAKLEEEIGNLEAEQQSEENLSDYVKLAEIGERLESLQAELETAYTEWEELAE